MNQGPSKLPDWDYAKTVTSAPEAAIPIAVWVTIALCCYAVLLALIIIIRQCVLSRGLCGECRVNCCEGKDEKDAEIGCGKWCMECCQDSCNCTSPNLTGCLDAICPHRRTTNCADLLTCQCCETCGSADGSCGDSNCDCETINCLCCECKLGGDSSRPTTNSN